MFDILIKKGIVVDGTGNPWYRADVGVEAGRIVAIGRLSGAKAERIIDADGLVVAPGFIDMHSHSDLMLLVEPDAKQKIMQGVTTEVIGQDGLSAAPMRADAVDHWRTYISGFDGDPDVDWDWSSFGDYLNRLEETGTSTNVASLIPHGNVRMVVMGEDNRRPTDAELKEMQRLVAASMEEGGFGLSTGLIYPPCVYAQTDELVELCRVVARFGGIFVVHMRNEGDQLLEAVKEVVKIGREAGLPVHISHFKASGKANWGKTKKALRLVEEARAKGVDVTVDQYPYTAGSTTLSSLLPPWVHEGGVDKLVKRLESAKERERMKRDIAQGIPWWQNWVVDCGWEGIYVSCVGTEKNKPLEGKNLVEIARIMNKPDEFTALCDLLLEEGGTGQMIVFYGSEDDVRYVMRHPVQMFCTDGLLGGKPHPRVYGTYPRVLGRYVREEGVLTLEEAVRKMTSLPAQTLGLRDRGMIRCGMAADITIFDPETVLDTATYQNPHQFPIGIKFVIVNGQITKENGKHTGVFAGKVLRHG